MTPGARIQAAIEVLDQIIAGEPAEKALTTWARGSRFAGSGDRAAVRDHVFDVVRMWRSCAAFGGAFSGADDQPTGRALMLGLLRQSCIEPKSLFSGAGHAPMALSAAECDLLDAEPTLTDLQALDCPDWLAPQLQGSLGDDFAPIMQALRSRAPVFIRVNQSRATVAGVIAELAQAGITAAPHPLSPHALQITDGARKLRNSPVLTDGRAEMQDAASQATVDMIPDLNDARALDFCAGGGGKALALAARGAIVSAHDINPARMSDLPARAARAGVSIPCLNPSELAQAGPFDMIVADAPCSGSGSWRRAPAAKWALTPARLTELQQIQAAILDQIAGLAGPKTQLVYITCSLLKTENDDQIADFLRRNPEWACAKMRHMTPVDGGDGFFTAHLHRV